VFLTFSTDFAFQNAHYTLKHVETIIKLLHVHSKEVLRRQVIAKFATVEEYFEDVRALNLTYPTFKSDLIPLIEVMDGLQDYWVGYYNSYPYLKAQIKKT
jgi:hypothetical protein